MIDDNSRTVLIFGGSMGIGSVPARRPAARGQRLVMTGLNQERLSAVKPAQ
jgi:short-subunit dehydrogenase